MTLPPCSSKPSSIKNAFGVLQLGYGESRGSTGSFPLHIPRTRGPNIRPPVQSNSLCVTQVMGVRVSVLIGSELGV